MKKTLALLLITLTIFVVGCGQKTSTTQTTQPAKTTTPSTASSSKVFTLSDLKQYDGKNGNATYVAVNGVVYDVSNTKAFKNGNHQGNSAGVDLSSAIKDAPHGESVLADLPVLGKLSN